MVVYIYLAIYLSTCSCMISSCDVSLVSASVNLSIYLPVRNLVV